MTLNVTGGMLSDISWSYRLCIN